MIAEGKQIPKFEGVNAKGQKIRSSDLKGKRHVIYFYPKDFTPGCTTQADEFAKNFKKFQAANIEIIGISPDDIESHQKFCKKMNIEYTLLSDTDKKIANAFGVWGKKKFMGREYMGVNRSTFLVDENGTIIKAYTKVKPAGHAIKVLEDFIK